MLGIDGGFRPAVEPLWDPSREASGGTLHHNTDTAATSSAMGPCLDAIRAGGETRCLLILPCAKDGMQSADVDNPSGGLANNWTVLSNVMGRRIKQAMRFPNPVMGGVFLSTGLGDATAEASSPFVQGRLASFCNNVNTLVSGFGLSWAKSVHFWIGRLQNPNAAAFGSPSGNVTALNNALDALDTARADTVLVQEPVGSISGTVQQHLTYAARLTWGQNFGASWLAAS